MARLYTLIFFSLLTLTSIAQNSPSPFIGTNLSRGENLRVLRMAVSCAGEFTQSVPGNNDTEKVDEVLRQMKEWIAVINDIYGREFCVRFELISDNLLRQIIYTDPTTDPWPTMMGSGCDGSINILPIQPTVIDNAVGAQNYDISHVILSENGFGGGCAGAFKAGYSGGFDLPVTRHEIGHQFSQAHTINNGGLDNYEPENAGRSIMGGNTDAFAHSVTYHETARHLNTTEANTGTKVPTGNTIPTVNAGLDRSIPASTPFRLEAQATDPDAGDALTYSWDQHDGTSQQNLPVANDIAGALFSRLSPSPQAFRYFPKLSSVLNNNFSNAEEDLPTQSRDLNFRVTVNDNHKITYNNESVNASGINSDDIKIAVVNTGQAFAVTSQNLAVNYTGGTNQTITWQVAGTTNAPISTANVKITLSADGGVSFPIVLAETTPNDGSQMVNIPNINTTEARIKVEAIDNYFFAINTTQFTITQNQNVPGIRVVQTAPATIVNETDQTDTYQISLLTATTGLVTVQLTTDGQIEISKDGTNFSTTQTVLFGNTNPTTITVRGVFDNVPEGPTLSVIEQVVNASTDQANYPIGMIGQPVTVRVSDAQIPPIIGIDFDDEQSTDIPVNWTKISDIRNQSLMNLPLEDGTPTGIDLTTSSDQCGVGGCGWTSGDFPKPQHVQPLDALTGASYARGTVLFTWSGLEPNTSYSVYLFGLGVFGPMDQTVSIAGSGNPVVFDQAAPTGTMFVNGETSSTKLLADFGQDITSSATGTIVITVTSNNMVNGEMSFAGLGIRKNAAGCTPPVVSAPTLTQPDCENPKGQIVVNATGNNLEFSIDNGANWQTSNMFTNLDPGNYSVLVRFQASPTCPGAYQLNPIVLQTPDCSTCQTVVSTDIPKTIPSDQVATITSTLQIPFGGVITDVNVLNLVGTHTWMEDLTFTLKSPLGTQVELFGGLCGDGDDWNVNLDDEAGTAIDCSLNNGDTEQPQNPLAVFNGENPQGTWTLEIADGFAADGGELQSWSLEICGNLPTGNCPNSITLNQNPIPNGLSQADQLIQSKGTVLAGTDVTFQANAIELSADEVMQFEVQSTGVFQAIIAGCPQ